MALFRRFFYRKPPDQLLEITERVYVFDCCFSTHVPDEGEYRTYMNGIVAQLHNHFPNGTFMVLNFKDGDGRSLFSDLLAQNGMTVMDYPQQYERCPLLPMEMINHFLRSSENWLTVEGQHNILLLLCERGGWPLLAFMLAGLLLYRKQYTGEQKTLEMVYKQAPKDLLSLLTPLNPQPSQLRYLQYISRRNSMLDWATSDAPLAVDCIILQALPRYDQGQGCRPIVRVYGHEFSSRLSNISTKLLFSSSKVTKDIPYYQKEECDLVTIDIHCRVQGDVVLECIHLEDDLVSEKIIFRTMFHTEFVRENILMLTHSEVDVLWDVKDLISREFKAEVHFSDEPSLLPIITTEVVNKDDEDSETEVATPEEFFEAEEIFSSFVDAQDDMVASDDYPIEVSAQVDVAQVDKTLVDEGRHEFPLEDEPEQQVLQECTIDETSSIRGSTVEQQVFQECTIDETSSIRDSTVDPISNSLHNGEVQPEAYVFSEVATDAETLYKDDGASSKFEEDGNKQCEKEGSKQKLGGDNDEHKGLHDIVDETKVDKTLVDEGRHDIPLEDEPEQQLFPECTIDETSSIRGSTVDPISNSLHNGEVQPEAYVFSEVAADAETLYKDDGTSSKFEEDGNKQSEKEGPKQKLGGDTNEHKGLSMAHMKQLVYRSISDLDAVFTNKKNKEQDSPDVVARWIPSNKGSYMNSMHMHYPRSRHNSAPALLALGKDSVYGVKRKPQSAPASHSTSPWFPDSSAVEAAATPTSPSKSQVIKPCELSLVEIRTKHTSPSSISPPPSEAQNKEQDSPDVVARWIPSNKGSYTNSMHMHYPRSRHNSAPALLALDKDSVYGVKRKPQSAPASHSTSPWFPDSSAVEAAAAPTSPSKSQVIKPCELSLVEIRTKHTSPSSISPPPSEAPPPSESLSEIHALLPTSIPCEELSLSLPPPHPRPPRPIALQLPPPPRPPRPISLQLPPPAQPIPTPTVTPVPPSQPMSTPTLVFPPLPLFQPTTTSMPEHPPHPTSQPTTVLTPVHLPPPLPPPPSQPTTSPPPPPSPPSPYTLVPPPPPPSPATPVFTNTSTDVSPSPTPSPTPTSSEPTTPSPVPSSPTTPSPVPSSPTTPTDVPSPPPPPPSEPMSIPMPPSPPPSQPTSAPTTPPQSPSQPTSIPMPPPAPPSQPMPIPTLPPMPPPHPLPPPHSPSQPTSISMPPPPPSSQPMTTATPIPPPPSQPMPIPTPPPHPMHMPPPHPPPPPRSLSQATSIPTSSRLPPPPPPPPPFPSTHTTTYSLSLPAPPAQASSPCLQDSTPPSLSVDSSLAINLQGNQNHPPVPIPPISSSMENTSTVIPPPPPPPPPIWCKMVLVLSNSSTSGPFPFTFHAAYPSLPPNQGVYYLPQSLPQMTSAPQPTSIPPGFPGFSQPLALFGAPTQPFPSPATGVTLTQPFPPPFASGTLPPPTSWASTPSQPSGGAPRPRPRPPPPPPPPPPFGGAPPPPPLPRRHALARGAPRPPPPPRGAPGPPPPPGPPGGGGPPPPPPGARGGPPPPPGVGRGIGAFRGQARLAVKKSKLKPLHWSKVSRALKGSLWEELQKQGAPQVAPEFDASEIESLFCATAPGKDKGKDGAKNAAAAKPTKIQLIDLKRAYNVEIMLTKVKMSLPDLMTAILSLDNTVLDADQVENLIKFCPKKEEMELLKTYTGDPEMLGKCEQFFLELMKAPRMETKLKTFLFKIQFNSQLSDFKESLVIVNSACEEVRNSDKLKEILQKILVLGNTLNEGTARGAAVGYKLDSLLKLTDTRSTTSKMTLMHFLCKSLAAKNPDLLDFYNDLPNLEASTKIQLKSLADEMTSISKGLEKVKQELDASEHDGPDSEVFHRTLKEFIGSAESEVTNVMNTYAVAGKNAEAVAMYFGEDPNRIPLEQVTETLSNFVKLFQTACEENSKQAEADRKKAQKEAEAAENASKV